ncbi:MAG: response regulator [Thermodesulfobacteriota bacterium]|nr:response regulator [Thermodesulfobacteriota bacterium]
MPVDNSIKILIIDDMQTMRKIIKNILKQIGFNDFVEAENGAQALKVLEGKTTIDLIISDWNMPELNGLELLKKVKADDALKSIPFLMVTAEGLKENVLEAIKAGVNNYIVKPFTPAALQEKIDAIFASNG